MSWKSEPQSLDNCGLRAFEAGRLLVIIRITFSFVGLSIVDGNWLLFVGDWCPVHCSGSELWPSLAKFFIYLNIQGLS